jgi:peptidoglycan biosynthesis protein MviN/MurJ (putative lipid II flippase)
MPPVASAPATPAAPTAAAHGRAGLAMSMATFAMAAASAIQAVLYLSHFGTSGRTDGFFVAFALYTTFGVFCQSLRLTSVPLLVQPGARMTVRQFALALGLISVPIVIVCGPGAGALAGVLAPGLDPADRHVTQEALPILGGAMILQLWAAGVATILAIRGRFGGVALSYVAGACAGLVVFLGLVDVAGELTLGWSMLAMAIFTTGGMLLTLRASGGLGEGRATAGGRAVSDAGVVLGRTGVYLAFNVLFVITLSFASGSATGDSTVLSYAYLFASYLVAGTGTALGMSRIPEMTRAARTERAAVLADTVPQGFRYAMLLVAPAIAGLITAGAPLIHVVLPGSLDAAGVSSLRTFGLLLVPWTIAALLVSFLLPALFAVGRARLVNALALPLVAVHVAATALGDRLWGTEGAVGAFFVAPAIFAVILLLSGAGVVWRPLALELTRDALRFVLLSAAAFGAADLVGGLLSSAALTAFTTAILGCVLYGAGMLVVARRQVTVLLGVVRPSSS